MIVTGDFGADTGLYSYGDTTYSYSYSSSVIDGGSTYSYSSSVVYGEPTYSYSSTTTYIDGGSYDMSALDGAYSYSSSVVYGEPVTNSYTTSYTVTIDEDGNMIYPDGYEEMDPNDPTTWPGYDEDAVAGI